MAKPPDGRPQSEPDRLRNGIPRWPNRALNRREAADRVATAFPEMPRVPTVIYKICDRELWQASLPLFRGAPVDRRDGFIHFSTAAQVAETAARHFAGAADLVLVAVDADRLDTALKWELSRGGDLFPHLYGDLPSSAVLWVKPLPLGADGRHVFPELSA